MPKSTPGGLMSFDYFGTGDPADRAAAPPHVGYGLSPAPTGPAPVTPTGGLPVAALLLGLGGAGLCIAALLPWISIFGLLDLSGLRVHWGWLALLGGVLVLVAALEEATGALGRSSRVLLRGGAILGGLGGILAGLIVLGRLRQLSESVAQATGSADASGLGALGRQFLAAFTPHAAVGLWVAFVAGVVAIIGAVLAIAAP